MSRTFSAEAAREEERRKRSSNPKEPAPARPEILEGLSALQLCDLVALRLREEGIAGPDLGILRDRVAEMEEPDARTTAPAGRRAARRAELMRKLAAVDRLAMVDWNFVAEEGRDPVPLLDPYRSS